jgi:hypothetical protein
MSSEDPCTPCSRSDSHPSSLVRLFHEQGNTHHCLLYTFPDNFCRQGSPDVICGDPRIHCPILKFSCKAEFDSHLSDVTHNTQCRDCGYPFPDSERWEAHTLAVLTAKRYSGLTKIVCLLCDGKPTFVSQADLICHIKHHPVPQTMEKGRFCAVSYNMIGSFSFSIDPDAL